MFEPKPFIIVNLTIHALVLSSIPTLSHHYTFQEILECSCREPEVKEVPKEHPLKLARVRKNLSQNGLADKVGISRRTIKRIESGEVPHPSTRRLLVEYFGVSSVELGLIPDLVGSEEK